MPFASQQRGLKRPVSNGDGGGSVPWGSSVASGSGPAPPGMDSPQSSSAGITHVCGSGGGSIHSSASGSRDSAESSDAMRAPDSAASGLSRRGTTKAAAATAAAAAPAAVTSGAVDSMTDTKKSRGAGVATQQCEESVHGVGRSFGARGLLGGSRADGRPRSISRSTVAGRGRREVSIGGEAPEQAAVAAVAAATFTTTRGRVGMRKARRTYGR